MCHLLSNRPDWFDRGSRVRAVVPLRFLGCFRNAANCTPSVCFVKAVPALPWFSRDPQKPVCICVRHCAESGKVDGVHHARCSVQQMSDASHFVSDFLFRHPRIVNGFVKSFVVAFYNRLSFHAFFRSFTPSVDNLSTEVF